MPLCIQVARSAVYYGKYNAAKIASAGSPKIVPRAQLRDIGAGEAVESDDGLIAGKLRGSR